MAKAEDVCVGRLTISDRRRKIGDLLREVWGGHVPRVVLNEAVGAADERIAAHFGVDTEVEVDTEVWASETP